MKSWLLVPLCLVMLTGCGEDPVERPDPPTQDAGGMTPGDAGSDGGGSPDGGGATSDGGTRDSGQEETDAGTSTDAGTHTDAGSGDAGVPTQVSASQSVLSVDRTQGVTANGTDAVALTVTVKDASGRVLPGRSVSVTATGSANTLTLDATATDASGVVTGRLTSTRAEPKQLTAVADGVTLVSRPQVTFVASAPTQLAFRLPPRSSRLGATLSPSVDIVLLDAQGNVATGRTDTVTLTLGGGTTGAWLTGTASRSAVAGVARFTGLGVDLLGTGYTLTAAATGFTPVVSPPFDIVSAPKWKRLGPWGGALFFVAADPHSAQRLYTAPQSGSTGLYRSTDGGATWAPAVAGFPGRVRAVAFDPVTPGVLYASGTGSGLLFKTTNGGDTWTPSNQGLPSKTIYSLLVDASAPQVLYAGIDGGVYKSIDGGATWSAASTGLAAGIRSYALARQGSTLWLGTDIGPYTSPDAGATWTRANTGLSSDNYVNQVLVHPSGVFIASYRGVYKSTTGGASWTGRNSGLPGGTVQALAFDPAAPDTMYVTNTRGVYKSTDGAATWTLASTGLRGLGGEDVVLAGGNLVAAVDDPTTHSYGGIYISSDGAASWNESSTGIAGLSINAVAVHPTDPRIVYAANDGGLFKSVDGGESWSRLPTVANAQRLVFDPRSSQVLYVAGGLLYKTQDGGNSWTSTELAPQERALSVALDPRAPDTVYVGTERQKVYRSTDAGLTFSPVTLPATADFVNVRSMLVDPRNSSRVYAGTSHGLFTSTDAGQTWTSSPPNEIVSLALSSLDRTQFYAATTGDLYQSTNDGAAWRFIGITGTARAVAVDPLVPVIAYAGNKKTVDGGATWYGNSSSSEIPESILSVAVAPSRPSTMYYGVRAGSLYKSESAGE